MTLGQARAWEKERRRQVLMESAVLGWMGVKPEDLDPERKTAGRRQDIGEACGSRLIALCEPIYGGKLSAACRSCPGPQPKR